MLNRFKFTCLNYPFRIKQIGLKNLGEAGKIISNQTLRNAHFFSKSLIKHDRSYPLIGDTEYRKYYSPLKKDYPPKLFSYPKSGYIIYKSSKFYLLFKNSYISNYHRHDDDLSLVYSTNNEDWFVDGGLYIYDHHNKTGKEEKSP